MIKSPEEYLSALDFDASATLAQPEELNAEERAFVEKYIGIDALGTLPPVAPEPLPLLEAVEIQPRPVLVADREIVVASAQQEIAVLPQGAATTYLPAVAAPLPEVIVVPDRITEATAQAEMIQPVLEQDQQITSVAEEKCIEAVAPQATAVVSPDEVAEQLASDEQVELVADAQTTEAVETAVAEKAEQVAEVQVSKSVATTATGKAASVAPVSQASAETLLREKLKLEAEIQMVSFFVGGQLFLLPVEGIQEVLRHMELIKVPQAPEFVAGVINLRGKVTPIVHLAALVTNEEVQPYTNSNFIIITGVGNLQLGLIIDKVSSMHMVPQQKIIWNPESKLAEAAEFLGAIVDLDDRVCGMVSPEMITRLILPEY